VRKILSKIFWISFVFALFIQFRSVPIPEIHQNTIYKDFVDTSASIRGLQPIALVGDLQRTSVWELMMGREQNDAERDAIINEISRENPSLLIILGDMVYDGNSRDQWEYFDNLMDPVKDIPVLPVMGNHEYYGSKVNTTPSFTAERFPQIANSTWYTRLYGNIAFIIIDSNEKALSALKWSEQQLWYKEMLKKYDDDPDIKGIIVFSHHPPFTNSMVTGDEMHMQKAFVKPFLDSEKTAAFISGHAHTYENLKRDGKYFLVSGGGGGPRVFLNKNKDRHDDECSHKGIRPFHYVLLQPGENSVEVSVKGINKGETKFHLIDSFSIPLTQRN
jgi:predicted MPP superfamily phosphohydrolase